MIKVCDACSKPLHDEDAVVAVMLTEYHATNSIVSYALAKPAACIRLVHEECYE